MPYATRPMHDADSHIMEPPAWLEGHLADDLRAQLPVLGSADADSTQAFDVDRIRITMLAFAPDCSDDEAVTGFLHDMAGYAALGVDEIHLAPASSDPRAEIDAWSTALLPRVAEL